MEVLTSQLPSGGYGLNFSSVTVNPMTFLEISKYIENAPSDPLEKYLFDIKNLARDDQRIYDCYVMDVDFLIFYKKLITISGDLSYEINLVCPKCGKPIRKKVSIEKDIHFKQIEQSLMNGASVQINNTNYEAGAPTVKEFLKVFETYLKYKKVEDLNIIKTISLIKGFDKPGMANQIESDVFGATHDDVTLLICLRELYFDRVEPIEVFCPECNKGVAPEERRGTTVSIDKLIVDFFRDLIINSPIDGNKILFK